MPAGNKVTNLAKADDFAESTNGRKQSWKTFFNQELTEGHQNGSGDYLTVKQAPLNMSSKCSICGDNPCSCATGFLAA